MIAPLEATVLGALDGARRSVLGWAGRAPLVARCRRERPLRLTVVACAAVATAFVLAVTATLPLLAVAPVLLGVPHLASDVRYLMFRSSGVAALLLIAAALGLAGALQAAVLAGGLAVLWAGLCAGTRVWPRVLLLAAFALAGAAAVARPEATAFALAHGHNAVAVGLAAWLARERLRVASGRRRRSPIVGGLEPSQGSRSDAWNPPRFPHSGAWLPAGLVAVALLAIALGACDRWLAGPPLDDLLAVVVPAGARPVAARRWLALFAFTQAVHYSAWLHVVPDAVRTSARPVSFRRSFQLLCDDLGPAGGRAVVVLSLALPAAALLSLAGARRFYLSFSGFHVFLELAFIVRIVMGRR